MSVENEDRSCMCPMPETTLPTMQEIPKVPCECKNEKQMKMLKDIKCLEFAIVELAEYLDTHPNDEKALSLHNDYANEYRKMYEEYERRFGPLSIYCPCNSYRWIASPWPWGGGKA